MPLEYSDELLSAYLDGELSPAERAAVESQLAADPQARQLLDELRALSHEVQSLPRERADEQFAQRVVRAALAAQAGTGERRYSPGEITPAKLDGAPSLPHKVRRDRRLAVVLAAAAAVAAAVALWVFVGGGPDDGSGGTAIVQDPGTGDPGTGGPSVVDPPIVDPAVLETALARLRQAIPQEGEGLVLRVKIGGGQPAREALDAAFAAAGLASRKADDDTTGGHRFASDYSAKLAEKIAGQPAEATLAAADAVFVSAPLDALEKALAALASRPSAGLEISPLLAGRVVPEEDPRGENPGAGPPKPKHFTQRLAVDQLRLAKEAAPLAEITAAAAGSLDPAKPIRVLILVEQVGP